MNVVCEGYTEVIITSETDEDAPCAQFLKNDKKCL